MQKTFDLRFLTLDLFDGEGGAEGGSQASSADTQQSTTGETQAAQDAAVQAEKPAKSTKQERMKAFRELMNSEYKEEYASDVQRIVNQRFKETKALQETNERNQGIIDKLYARYGVSDIEALHSALDNDNAYWEKAAMDANMDVETFKRVTQAEQQLDAIRRDRERAEQDAAVQQMVQGWMQQAEALQADYPDFDWMAEMDDPNFVNAIKAGVPMKMVYEGKYHQQMVASSVQATRAQTEKSVADSIRAKGSRPAENGASSQSAFTTKMDVNKMTKKDINDIANRVLRGEKVPL